MPEVLKNQRSKIDSSKILQELKLDKKDFIVVSLHREENVDNLSSLTTIVDSINEIVKIYKKKIIFSVHPRTQKKLKLYGLESELIKDVIQLKPLGFNDYIKLQEASFCVISDSGTISEESSILKFPAITIRQSHERPEAMDEGTIIMTGFDKQNIIDSVKIITSLKVENVNTAQDYKAKNISDKVVKIIYSYVHYVNRNVWKKF